MADVSESHAVEETLTALEAARTRLKHYERALNLQWPMDAPAKPGSGPVLCRIQRWALIVELLEREAKYEVTPQPVRIRPM